MQDEVFDGTVITPKMAEFMVILALEGGSWFRPEGVRIGQAAHYNELYRLAKADLVAFGAADLTNGRLPWVLTVKGWHWVKNGGDNGAQS